MNIASTYREFLGALKGEFTFPGLHREVPISGIVGVVFANPHLKLPKDVIMENIDYFNTRSSFHIDFYFPGYYTWGGPFGKTDIDIAGPNDEPWHYSTELFVRFVSNLESASKWNYSGETELLLFDYYEGIPNFKKTMVILLERALQDGRIPSVNILFEEIFRIARHHPELLSLRNQMILDATVDVMKDKIASFLNKHSLGIYDATSVYFTKDLSSKD